MQRGFLKTKAKAKGKKATPSGGSQLSDYEIQRNDNLKRNAEYMTSKGAGSLANMILQQKTKVAGNRNVLLDEDDDSTSENDEDVNDNEIRENMQSRLGDAVRKKYPDTSPQKVQKVQNVQEKVQKVQDKIAAAHVVQKRQADPVMRQTDAMVQKKQKMQAKQKNQKKQQVYCPPGSMSSYLEMRKKQVEKEASSANNFLLSDANTTLMTADCDDELNELDDNLNVNDNDDNDVGNDHEEEMEVDAQEVTGKEASQNENHRGPRKLNFEAEVDAENDNENEAGQKKNHRGPTKLTQVHARTKDERELIILNTFGQPIGPTPKHVEEFKFFLGTLGKDPDLAPLNYTSFPHLPTHDKIWQYVLAKYMISEDGKKFVMESVNLSWRVHKCRVKKKHYYAYATDELRWANKPATISVPHFKELLEYWHCEKIQEESKVNRENRLMLDDVHTLGRKSLGELRYELEQANPDKQQPSDAQVYKESRKRVSGRKYLTASEKAEEKIAMIDALESSPGEGSNSKDLSELVLDSKRKDRLRLYGKGVKQSDLKKKDKKGGFIFPAEFLESVKSQLVQQIAPSLATIIVTQLQDANPGIDLVVPDFSGLSIAKDANSAPHGVEPNGQSGDTNNETVNQTESD